MRFSIFYFTTLFSILSAQIDHGGEPLYHLNNQVQSIPSISSANFTRLASETLFHEKVFVYGDVYAVNTDFFNHADLIQNNGIHSWLLEIQSPGAKAIGFKFDQFNLPQGAELFVYPSSGEFFKGRFTTQNHTPDGKFSIQPIKSDRVILELNIYEESQENAVIHIKDIIHDFTDIMAYYSDESVQDRNDCNLNVACPESVGWENQINAVVRLDMGGGLCSASLINNTGNDLTPYVLTANHCISGSPSYYTFNFNYQATYCNGNSGSTSQSMSGSVLRASGSGPDFALLELNSSVPENYNPFFNGWNVGNAAPDNPTGVHHPGAEIKKFSFTDDYVSSSWDGNYWEFQFDPGRVIPGSSGSPLFDQNQHTVGIASYIYTDYCYEYNCYCDQQYDAGYGRVDQAWDWGSNSASRLSDWLDPMNSGVTILDGIDINGFLQAELDYSISGDLDVSLADNESSQVMFNLSNIGEPESILDYSITSSPFSVSGDSPDDFGYQWSDTEINPDLSPVWIDISGMGTLYSFPHNDQAGQAVDIGFHFPFYGQEYNQCIINANGWIGFGADNDSWENGEIPNNTAPNPAILGFWDDLNPVNDACNASCSGNVYTYTDGEKFVVWFNDVAHWASSDYTESFYNFQMVLYADGRFDVNYNTITSNYSPTIGTQNEGGLDGHQVYFAGNATSGEWLAGDKSLQFSASPTWLGINQQGNSSAQGNIVAGENETVNILYSNDGLAEGDYSAYISLITNTDEPIAFPVNLTATGIPGMLGDINQDETLNVLDVVICVNIILGDYIPDSNEAWAADLNEDGETNVLDIVSLINMILDGV